jgi:CheY-like chemotaxis protein
MNAEFAVPADAPALGGNQRVLVVEDDPVMRRLLRMWLHRAGLTVLSADSGEEALKLCEEDPAPIHLLVTDGVMPGIDGFELARRLSEREPPVRTILLSGYLHHFVSRPDIPWNVEAFFAKPVSGNELVAKALEIVGVTA